MLLRINLPLNTYVKYYNPFKHNMHMVLVEPKIQTIYITLTLGDSYSKSFFISTIKEWNKLEKSFCNAPSLASFKFRLNKHHHTPPTYLSNNISRHAQIVILQLRLGFSDLNSHLFDKGCIESPQCNCSHNYENINHFLFQCPLYQNIRTSFMTSINQLQIEDPITVNLILFGTNLPDETNEIMQKHLSEMITNSKRFLNREIVIVN